MSKRKPLLTNVSEEDKQYLIKQYQKRRPVKNGKKYYTPLQLENDWLYCELGAEMPFPFLLSEDFQDTRAHVMQVTIRDIRLDDDYQRHGVLTKFLEYLLVERGIGVQLESVQPQWLKKRLQQSRLWFLQQRPVYSQDNGGGELLCPSFCRITGMVAGEKQFRLF